MTVPPAGWSSSQTAPSSAAAVPPPPPTVVNRTVARPVANLGNTCYVNCVLQALAHAPELLMGMDCEPHRSICPTAAENQAKLQRLRTSQAARRRKTASRSNSPTDEAAAPVLPPRKGTRKSRRRSPQQQSAAAAAAGGDANNNNSNSPSNSDEPTFCALCEVEEHLQAVHDSTAKRDKPVVPSNFVHGFIDHVAPWFKLGVQEDSHEFLRLLIDAMQKSCRNARQSKSSNTGNDENNKNDTNQQTTTTDAAAAAGSSTSSPQDTGAAPAAAADKPQDNKKEDDDVDTEYPFSLFRGTVESTVTCESCGASSSTLDPIEDVGLEVTVPATEQQQQQPLPEVSSRSGRSSSRTNSPIPTHHAQLADVQSAFARFARPEALDAGYKCEQCGKVGRAIKQSHLASIPPILTVQLKRFRYGGHEAVMVRGAGSSGMAPAGASTSSGPTTRSGRAQRSMNNEVNQLLASSAYYQNSGTGGSSGAGADYGGGGGGSAAYNYWATAGKSGSAKIEGHIKFDLFFDLKPYLTPQLQKQHANMYCRLFAVVVHCGKNSHSGHYLAYVRNLSKNEWWKMDDGRVSAVPQREVMQAEAYMLFYRVVQHPIALRLDELNKQRTAAAAAAAAAAVKEEEPATTEADAADKKKKAADNAAAVADQKKDKATTTTTTTTAPATAATAATSTQNRGKKRPAPDHDDHADAAAATSATSASGTTTTTTAFRDGYEWANAKKTNVRPDLLKLLIRKCHAHISENVKLSNDYFVQIRQEAAADNAAAVGRGPATRITEEDVVGGADDFRKILSHLFMNVAQYLDEDGISLINTAATTSAAAATTTASSDKNPASSEKRIAVVEPEDTDLL